MTQNDMTRPLGGRAKCDLFGDASHLPNTPSDWRTQLIAGRHCLPLTLAQHVCFELFGGCADD
jgi:hypothetical protein